MGYQTRTNAVRQQDAKRQRKRNTGNAGRATQQTIQKREELMTLLKEQFDGRKPSESIFDDIPIPEASSKEKRILEVLFKDPHNYLTNQQIAQIVGCERGDVGKFRESKRMYSLLSNSEIVDRVLERLKIKTLMALERNIDIGDNTAMDKVLKMCGMLRDAGTNILVINDRDAIESVTASLNTLLLDNRKTDDTTQTVDAEYVVEND